MNAAEGLAVVGCMIAACRHGDRVHTRPTRDRLATVMLRDLRAWTYLGRTDPALRRLWTEVVRRAQPGQVAAAASLLALANSR
jgi:hypothetical protein